jgi:hypothetical protein
MARAINTHTSGGLASGHEGEHESDVPEVGVGEKHAHKPDSTADHHQHEMKTKHTEENVNEN